MLLAYAVVSALALLGPMSAQATDVSFNQGYYTFSNWTITDSSDAQDGSVSNNTPAHDQVELAGPTTRGVTSMTIAAAAAGTFEFSWQYFNADPAINFGSDAGYYLYYGDANSPDAAGRHSLVSNGDNVWHGFSGVIDIVAVNGVLPIIGFYVSSNRNSVPDPSYFDVGQFIAPLAPSAAPEPSSLSLLAVGALGLAARRRARRSTRA